MSACLPLRFEKEKKKFRLKMRLAEDILFYFILTLQIWNDIKRGEQLMEQQTEIMMADNIELSPLSDCS